MNTYQSEYIALITGANAGIGLELTKHLLSQCWQVVTYSKQGREKHYELMTVVPYIILMELKDLLNSGSLKTVINTSSSALRFTRGFSIEILERPKSFRKLLGPYATSKLALSLWTQAISPQLAKEDIKIRSVDPGSNNTLRKDKKSGLPFLVHGLMKLFFPPPTHGAGKLYEGVTPKSQSMKVVIASSNALIMTAPSNRRPEPASILELTHDIGSIDQ